MSSTSIKLKATAKDGMVEVKALIAHPMESGQRKDEETGKLIPKHYITNVTVTANDKTVFSSQWGGAISKNPYLAFSYQGKVGDKIKLSWKDSKGKSDSAETVAVAA